MNQTKKKQTKPLTATDLVVNQKYVPFQKTVGRIKNPKGEDELTSSVVWKAAKRDGQPFLYYTGLNDGGSVHCFNYKPRLVGEDATGDFFNPADVTVYIDDCIDELEDEITVTECTYTPKATTIHERIVAELNLEIGDLVEVTHKAPSFNLGWNNNWTDSMDMAVGKRFKVIDIDPETGISFDSAELLGYSYPAQCLRLVKRKVEPVIVELNDELAAVVEDGIISVYGQSISFEAVRRLYEAVESYKASGPCE